LIKFDIFTITGSYEEDHFIGLIELNEW